MKENSSQQLHMLRYTLTEQLIHGMEVSNLAYDLGNWGMRKKSAMSLQKRAFSTISERLYWRIT